MRLHSSERSLTQHHPSEIQDATFRLNQQFYLTQEEAASWNTDLQLAWTKKR